MKNILLFLFLFCFFNSYGQLNLYAERRNIDNTIDSFFVKSVKDSIFNKNGVYILKTVESFEGQFEPVYPNGFASFFKCADGIYRNGRYFSGYPVSVVAINANAVTNLTLTNQANVEQQLGNSLTNSVKVNTASFQEVRLTAYVMAGSASVNNPRIYYQYSTNGTSWIGGGNGISLSTTGHKETAWASLPEGAKGEIYIRVAQNGGDGASDPALGTVTIQFR